MPEWAVFPWWEVPRDPREALGGHLSIEELVVLYYGERGSLICDRSSTYVVLSGAGECLTG